MADGHLPASHVRLPKSRPRSVVEWKRRSVLALALLATLWRQHTTTARAAFGRYGRMQLCAIRGRMRLIGVGPARPLPDPFLLGFQQRLDLRHCIFLTDVLDRRFHRYDR